jgi:hypothetical protein
MLGYLRLLTNHKVMGGSTTTLARALQLYDRWTEDPRVELAPEPRGAETLFRQAAAPYALQPATKAIADCYLVGFREAGRCPPRHFLTGAWQQPCGSGMSRSHYWKRSIAGQRLCLGRKPSTRAAAPRSDRPPGRRAPYIQLGLRESINRRHFRPGGRKMTRAAHEPAAALRQGSDLNTFFQVANTPL